MVTLPALATAIARLISSTLYSSIACLMMISSPHGVIIAVGIEAIPLIHGIDC